MKRAVLLISAWISLSYCQNYEGLVTTTTYGGLALPASGNGGAFPSPALGIEPMRNVGTHFGIGGHLEYAWFGVKKPASVTQDFSMGAHVMDFACVPKYMLPCGNKATFTAELDPGLYVTYFYFILGTSSSSLVGKYFGITEGLAARIGSCAVSVKCKTMFAEVFKKGFDTMLSTENALTWFTFTIGVEI